MIFLLPLILVIAVIFGVDYLYFGKENERAKAEKIQKEANQSLENARQKYIKELFENQ